VSPWQLFCTEAGIDKYFFDNLSQHGRKLMCKSKTMHYWQIFKPNGCMKNKQTTASLSGAMQKYIERESSFTSWEARSFVSYYYNDC
jgi:hypothetical protein